MVWKNVQADKAVADVIVLMNRVTVGKVSLWDIYLLTDKEPLHMWYFATSINARTLCGLLLEI